MSSTIIIATLCAIIVALAWMAHAAHRKYLSTARKIVFMLNSMDNDDFSFAFKTSNLTTREQEVNKSLNLLSGLLMKARNKAIERENFYDIIINSVKTGIMVVGDDGRVLQTNDSARQLTGLDVITHTQQLQRLSPELTQAIDEIKGGEKRQTTLQNERGTIHLLIQASETTQEGKRVRIIAMNDLDSELNQNEQDSWTKLIRVLTHEIMNTVAPITSLSETLLAKAQQEGTKEMREGLQLIKDASQGLTEFVENYRKFTHLPTPVPSLFYAKALAERCITMARQVAHKADVEFRLCVEPADLIVYADESLMAHVLDNLLKNALQAIDKGGTGRGNVWIDARAQADESIVISVTNDGPLIPDDMAQHIFVPFFTTKEDGSGIGLPISRQIMRLSGGTLTLKTDNKRALTTFEMMLP